MYIDWTYIVLVLPAVLFAMWASSNVSHTYEKYSKQYNSRRLTGAQAARWVLDANGLREVPIERIDGQLTDHYDPKDNVVRLSPVFIYAAYIGVALYGLCAIFQLVTLPTEFNASSRALATIEGMELLRGEELDGAAKVLRAAALTYVAALAVTLMQLLRFVLILSNRRD